MEKIVLVMTSLNPDGFKINRALRSARGFDEIYLHIDAASSFTPHIDLTKIEPPVIIVENEKPLKVDEAYNFIIESIPGDPWICCFCDDDFFDPIGLTELLASIRAGNHLAADIIHFQVHVSGNKPYHQWGAAQVSDKNIKEANPIPAGSFFKKSAWTKAGGFQGSIWHDWVMWLRAHKAGCKFKFFEQPVYWFIMRPDSAAERQLAAFDGSIEKARESVLAHAA